MDTCPAGWTEAIGRLQEGLVRRVVVLGATDTGKSTFIRVALSAAAGAGISLPLIDLDPGQKMIGPPGTACLGGEGRVQRMVFIGSTSAGEVARIAAAAASLARSAPHGFIANTAGFVQGLGARLQALTIAALQPDTIVAIGEVESLREVIDAHPNIPLFRLDRSDLARRKSRSERTQVRQAAFAAALHRAGHLALPTDKLVFTPAPPVSLQGAERPVCAFARADGEVIAVGILQSAGADAVAFAEPEASAAAEVQLGKMWARPSPSGWRLLEELRPGWQPHPVADRCSSVAP